MQLLLPACRRAAAAKLPAAAFHQRGCLARHPCSAPAAPELVECAELALRALKRCACWSAAHLAWLRMVHGSNLLNMLAAEEAAEQFTPGVQRAARDLKVCAYVEGGRRGQRVPLREPSAAWLLLCCCCWRVAAAAGPAYPMR